MKIAIIGHFGGKKQFSDGQTVKTRTLYHALADEGLSICPIDTYDFKCNLLRFIWQFCKSMVSCKKYIVLLSENGRRKLFPVLYILIKLFRKQVYHDAIGGRLADEVQNKSHFKRYVSAFSGNWVESHLLEKRLQEQGVKNALYLPNFKQITPLTQNQLPPAANKPMRFCTFSRVMREKGVGDAINALAQLNKGKNTTAVLDIYGPIDPAFAAEFERLLATHQSFCNYKGIVPADESVNVLKNYDMLLFPTYWKGEGMPGTIIDAFCAGVPILARWWTYCDEMIAHQKTGWVYDFDKPEKLGTWLAYAVAHPQEIYAMKKDCLTAGKAYTAKTVVPDILELLEGSI